MEHIYFALYVVSLSLGCGLVVLAFLFSRRYGSLPLRLLGLLLVAGCLQILDEGLKDYEHALRLAFGPMHAPVLALLCGLSSGAMAYLVPRLSFSLIGVPVGRRRRIVHLFIAAAAVVVGALEEGPAPELFWKLNFALLVGVHGYGLGILAPNLSRISNHRVRSLVRIILILVCVCSPFAVGQLIVRDWAPMPVAIRDYPAEPLAYFLAVAVVLYLYAGRFLVAPSVSADFLLSEASAARYSISPREREIISLVLRGYSRKEIGERLFISSRTVKNHVYNIYQKTGVVNRVQLLNLFQPAER